MRGGRLGGMSKERRRPDKSRLSFPEMELAVLDEMCDAFTRGAGKELYARVLVDNFGVDEMRAGSLFRRLCVLGAIEEYETPSYLSPTRTPGRAYRISGNVCDVAADRRAALEAKPDQVSAIEKKARSHWVFAGLIVLAALYLFTVTAINQTLELIDKWRDDAPPAALTGEAK
jgi:hypothetical protein